jgi:peptidoglycan/LPS O-acetylase OafA/YrhL
MLCIFWQDGICGWLTSLEPIKTFLKALLITGYGTVYVTPQGMNYFTTDYLFKNTMNGSSWTLLFEIIEYIMIATVLCLFRNKNLAVAIPLIMAAVLLIYCNAISVAHMKLISLGFLILKPKPNAVPCRGADER